MADGTTTVGASIGLPIESRTLTGWLRACARTLARTASHPSASYVRCPEPIAHARVLAYLATLRLPAWVLLVGVIAARTLRADGPPPIPLHSIHLWIDPALAQALSAWLVLMIPVGLPASYFLCGLLAHVGIALTGGARRSIGASMRAFGIASGPALLLMGVLDLRVYLGDPSGLAVLRAVAIAAVAVVALAGFALARTHQISVLRGLFVAVPPAALLATTAALRLALVIHELPGVPLPDAPYYVP